MQKLILYRIQENEIVGRVAAIINWDEVNNQQKKKKVWFWFDVLLMILK
jgi:hypothetical protein